LCYSARPSARLRCVTRRGLQPACDGTRGDGRC